MLFSTALMAHLSFPCSFNAPVIFNKRENIIAFSHFLKREMFFFIVRTSRWKAIHTSHSAWAVWKQRLSAFQQSSIHLSWRSYSDHGQGVRFWLWLVFCNQFSLFHNFFVTHPHSLYFRRSIFFTHFLTVLHFPCPFCFAVLLGNHRSVSSFSALSSCVLTSFVSVVAVGSSSEFRWERDNESWLSEGGPGHLWCQP